LSCIEQGYPLPEGGKVAIAADVSGALFATDAQSAARQAPYRTGIDLSITEAGEPAFGAFVFVHVEPSEALALLPADDERTAEPTCGVVDGAFRCGATEEGRARFRVESRGGWSGDAVVVVTWAETGEARRTIPVSPPGLPLDATSFDLVVGSATGRVLATYLALACTTGPAPETPDEKWRAGEIRAVEAYARATPPAASPGVVEHAPVLVESLSSEGALSLDADCADRSTRLRVELGATGESPRFYLCFSDLGGDVTFAASSGEQSGDRAPPPHTLSVQPEPRLLRVVALATQAHVGEVETLFEVSAYDAARERIAMDVDLAIDSDVLLLGQASAALGEDGAAPTLLDAEAIAPGATALHVTPRLLAAPDCASATVTVVP
jgi:hypothetical protein